MTILAENRKSPWTQEADQVAWKPRDSMGAVVFKDHLWILGGWMDSYAPCPRDVWKSGDGRAWSRVLEVAPWKHSDFPMCVAFQDRIWVMGGWYNGRLPDSEASNEVWSSPDGKSWKQSAQNAAWSPRLGSGIVSFQGKIWILGGLEKYFGGDESNLKNDVWSSSDGGEWELVAAEAPWPARAFHQAVVFKDKIWVLGGGNYTPGYKAFSDVWSSSDGKSWQKVTEAASWLARLWFSSLVYRDHLWVFGGWSDHPFQDSNDVWFSPDGKSWQALQSDPVWNKRHAQAAYVFQDKIWVAGGHARPLSNEVWSLHIPDFQDDQLPGMVIS